MSKKDKTFFPESKKGDNSIGVLTVLLHVVFFPPKDT